MEDMYTRTEMLIGDKVNALKNARVLVCGVGGVGGYVVEALARSGIGEITVFDNDVIAVTRNPVAGIDKQSLVLLAPRPRYLA